MSFTERIKPANRMVGIDFIKLMACMGVIGLHTFQLGESSGNRILFFLAGYSIPLFFMVNGFLLLGKEKLNYTYLKNKGRNIIILVFLWNLVWALYKFFCKGEIHNPILESLKNLFLQQGNFSIFWFFGALLLVYLLAPFLQELIRRNQGRPLMAVLLESCILIDILSVFCTLKTGRPLQSYIPQAFRMWTWLFYFTLGGCIANGYFKKYCALASGTKAGFLLVSVWANIFYQYFIGYRIIGIRMTEYFYDNIFMIIEVFCLFAAVKQYRFRNSAALILWLASGLTGVYVLHMTLISHMSGIYDFENVFLNVLSLPIIFTACFLAGKLMEKIPFLNRMLKI